MGLSAGQYLSFEGCFCSVNHLTVMKWRVLSHHTNPCRWGMSRLIQTTDMGSPERSNEQFTICLMVLAHEEVAVWETREQITDHKLILERKQVWFLLFSYSSLSIICWCRYSKLTLIPMPCFRLCQQTFTDFQAWYLTYYIQTCSLDISNSHVP